MTELNRFAVLAFAVFASLSMAVPAGFEDPALYEKVMGGQIVRTSLIDTKIETKMVIRAYFDKVSTDAFFNLVTNYPKYPSLFEEVTAGRLKSTENEKSILNYELDLDVQVGLMHFNETAVCRHEWKPGADQQSESVLQNRLNNFQEYVQFTTQSTRVIPWENGILIEDTVHLKLKKADMAGNMAKKKLVEFLGKYLVALKAELQG